MFVRGKFTYFLFYTNEASVSIPMLVTVQSNQQHLRAYGKRPAFDQIPRTFGAVSLKSGFLS